MSIIFQFGPSLLQSSTIPPATTTCSAQAESILRMGPGLENDSNLSLLSADDSSMVDVSTSSVQLYSEKEDVSVPRQPSTCFGLPYQDHNYGAPPPPTPPTQSPHLSPAYVGPVVETETVSIVTTTYENEEVQESSITRCVCGFDHDDEYMICCDRCLVWQHVDCMGLDRTNIPDTYLCEQCEPRKVDKQRAKLLQSKKKVHLREKSTVNETSEDSDGEGSNQRGRSRSARRRSVVEKDAKNEPTVIKKTKAQSKQLKERMEMKRSKLRRRVRSKSETNCNTPDEEAQDAWKCSLDWGKKNSADNWYSDDIKLLASTLKNQGDEAKLAKQLQAQLCKVVEVSENVKKLVADQDLLRDQAVVEWKGRFLSSSEFHQTHPLFKQRLFPYVLFYKLHSGEEMCVDSTDYANDARFVRRSCTPNAEVKHMVLNGSLHLYISSTKEIMKDEEITIPFDVDSKVFGHDLSCACASDSCQLLSHHKNGVQDSCDRKRRGKRQVHSTDDDSNHSSTCTVMSPAKPCKGSPTKLCNLSPKISQSESLPEQSEGRVLSEEPDADDLHRENKRKMTREERKIDAIMRAFDQMEKAAKRRKQALDRLAHQRLQSQKSEEPPEKQESSNSSVPTTKEEEKPVNQPPVESSSSSTAAAPVSAAEEEKPAVSQNSTSKNKKGKRRRGSGTSSRRRTRTNSGGSDVFTNDETSYCDSGLQCLSSASSVEASDAASVELSVTSPSTPLVTNTAAPVLPKTKRFLHHEWLQEKAETVPVLSPLPVRTEMNWKVTSPVPTCYVQCIKDSPTGGISAAHLRRSSVGGSHCKQTSGQGSAKKRWLRQAMYDCEPSESEAVNEAVNGETLSSPIHSPPAQTEMVSPCILSQDESHVVTPLKKRRIMRNSVESLSEWTLTSSGGSPDHSSSEAANDCITDPAHVVKELYVELSNKDGEHTDKDSGGNGINKHLLKSLRENWLKKQENHAGTCFEEADPCFAVSPHCSAAVNIKQENAVSQTSVVSIKTEGPSDNNNTVTSEDSPAFHSVEESLKSEPDDTKIITSLNSSHASVGERLRGRTTSEIGGESPVVDQVSVTKSLMVDSCEKDPSRSTSDADLPSCYNSLQTHGARSDENKATIKEEPAEVVAESEVNGSEEGPRSAIGQCDSNMKQNDPVIGFSGRQSEEEICNKTDVKVWQQSDSSNAQAEKANKDETLNVNSVNSCDVKVFGHAKSSVIYENHQSENQEHPTVHTVESHAATTATSEGNENPAEATAPRKRKVTLSEYRQRKRENHTVTTVSSNEKKKSNNCILESSEKLESLSKDEIKLAALPLFDKPPKTLKMGGGGSSLNDKKGERSKEKRRVSEHHVAPPPPQKREKLADRLKREFGVEDVSDSHEEKKAKAGVEHQKTVSPLLGVKPEVSPMLPYCTQLPVLNSTTGSAQFGFAGAPQTYAQPSSFIVSQVPSGQYMDGQSHVVSAPMIPAMHPLGVAVNPPPPPPPPPPQTQQQGCTYSAAMHTEVSRQSHFYYHSTNSQTFVNSTQPPPPPPQPTVYNSPFKSRAYK